MVREASGFTDLLDRSSDGCSVGGRMVMGVVRGGGEREEGNEEEEEETSGHGHGHGG